LLKIIECAVVFGSAGFVAGTIYGKKLAAAIVADVKKEIQNLRNDVASRVGIKI
jgi:hypothetical protein